MLNRYEERKDVVDMEAIYQRRWVLSRNAISPRFYRIDGLGFGWIALETWWWREICEMALHIAPKRAGEGKGEFSFRPKREIDGGGVSR